MMMNKTKKPLTEQEKQCQPLPGETSPEDALQKATEFVAIEKNRLKNKRPKV